MAGGEREGRWEERGVRRKGRKRLWKRERKGRESEYEISKRLGRVRGRGIE